MRNFIKKAIVWSLACLLVTGCRKFLDQPVPGALPEKDFYKTDLDATQAVTAVYDMMQAHYNNNWGSLYMIKTLLSDETNTGGPMRATNLVTRVSTNTISTQPMTK